VCLPVANRVLLPATVSPHINPTVVKLGLNSTIKRAPNPPSEIEPASSLLSPPPSPPPPYPPLSPAAMDRSMLHGAPSRGAPPPSRGPPRPAFGNQDARGSRDTCSNLAVQPADHAGSLKLKKKAVKIVGAAGPAPSMPPRAPPAPASVPARTTPAVSSPVAGPVKAEPTEVERYELSTAKSVQQLETNAMLTVLNPQSPFPRSLRL
jgi:hypothetical protein